MATATAPSGTWTKPRPIVHPENEPYWAGLREHELRLQRCLECGLLRWPISPVCHRCCSSGHQSVPAAGAGTVRASVVIVRATGHPAWGEDVPFVVALVDLDEGPRLTARVVDVPPEELAPGTRVGPVFADVDHDLTLLEFHTTGG